MQLKVITSFIFLCMITGINCREYYHIDGRTYYSSYPDMRNWYLAKQFCTSMGYYLVDIHSDAEQKRIVSVITSTEAANKIASQEYWTSGTNQGTIGRQFYWDTTGHTFIYTNWHDGEPNNYKELNEQCVHVRSLSYNRRWNDFQCTEILPFICRDTFDAPSYEVKQCLL